MTDQQYTIPALSVTIRASSVCPGGQRWQSRPIMGQGAGILPLPLPQSECWSCEFPLLIWGSTVYSCWGYKLGLQRHRHWYMGTGIRLLVSVGLICSLLYGLMGSNLLSITLIKIKIIPLHSVWDNYATFMSECFREWDIYFEKPKHCVRSPNGFALTLLITFSYCDPERKMRRQHSPYSFLQNSLVNKYPSFEPNILGELFSSWTVAA